MNKYILQNIKVEKGVAHIVLVPKNRSYGLAFRPGQYAAIAFKRHGRFSPMRCFSIASSSTDTSKIEFGIRIMGDFTQTIARLSEGTEFMVEGPFGEFQVNDVDDYALVFIAGGIGITPFMSMIRTAASTNSLKTITLLYSNRSASAIPFLEELREIESRYPKFKMVTFISDGGPLENNKLSVAGTINESHIAKIINSAIPNTTYFLCGPTGFMKSMNLILSDHGVNEDRIIDESFTQSTKIVSEGGKNISKMVYAFSGTLMLVGLLGIAGLDLIRYIPKHTNASVVQPAATTGQTSTTPTTGSSTSSTSSSSNSQTGSSTGSATSSYNQTQTTNNNSNVQYQQPVSTRS